MHDATIRTALKRVPCSKCTSNSQIASRGGVVESWFPALSRGYPLLVSQVLPLFFFFVSRFAYFLVYSWLPFVGYVFFTASFFFGAERRQRRISALRSFVFDGSRDPFLLSGFEGPVTCVGLFLALLASIRMTQRVEPKADRPAKDG